MRNRNKIVMIIVSILLCLTLISTSLVSSVFAKYTKTATGKLEQVSLKKFGVTITATSPQETTLESVGGATVTMQSSGSYLTSTISGLKMAPGDDYYKALNFAFTGQPTVPVIVKIAVQLNFGTGNTVVETNPFYVTTDNVSELSNANYFMPIGFTFSSGASSAAGNYALNPWTNSTTAADMTASEISNDIASGIAGKFTSGKATASGNTVTTVQFPAVTTSTQGTNLTLPIGSASVNNFDLGFAWPLDHGSGDNKTKYDNLATWISENKYNETFTVTYTVSIEQDNTSAS